MEYSRAHYVPQWPEYGTGENVTPFLSRAQHAFSPEPDGKRVFHYTHLDGLAQILRDRLIKPTRLVFDESGRYFQAVYLSTNEHYEIGSLHVPVTCLTFFGLPTLTRVERRLRGMKAMERFGLFRLEVAPSSAPFRWHHLRACLPTEYVAWEERMCFRAGNDIREWRFSLDAIPSSEWIGIELWNGEKWSALPRDQRLRPADASQDGISS